MFTQEQIDETLNWLDAEGTNESHMARDIIEELRQDLRDSCGNYKKEAIRLLCTGLMKTRYEDDMEPIMVPKWYWRYVQNLETDAKKAYDLLSEEWSRYHKIGDLSPTS